MFKSRYYDSWIDLSIIFLTIFGIVMIGSASVGELFPAHISEETGEIVSTLTTSSMFAIKNMAKQIFFVATGFILTLLARKFFIVKKINLTVIRILYVGALIAMVACLAFEPVNGAQAWIRFGNLFTIQPSEFAKLVCIILLAFYLTEVPDAFRISNNMSYEVRQAMIQQGFIRGIVEPVAYCVILFAICVFLQNDFGTAVIIAFVCVVCFFSANHPFYKKYHKQLWALMFAAIALLLIVGSIFLKGYQMSRITSWLDPLNSEYVLGASYQLVNGMIAFSHNGLLGAGLGNSTQKFGYIPEAYNDFIGAIVFEELGIFGLACMIVPYTIIIYRCFTYAFKMNDSFSKITLCGIGGYFFIHLFLNLGGISGLIPMTGVPLLCISAGGSSTWAAFIAVGIAQAIIKRYNRSQMKA